MWVYRSNLMVILVFDLYYWLQEIEYWHEKFEVENLTWCDYVSDPITRLKVGEQERILEIIEATKLG